MPRYCRGTTCHAPTDAAIYIIVQEKSVVELSSGNKKLSEIHFTFAIDSYTDTGLVKFTFNISFMTWTFEPTLNSLSRWVCITLIVGNIFRSCFIWYVNCFDAIPSKMVAKGIAKILMTKCDLCTGHILAVDSGLIINFRTTCKCW